MPMTKTKVAKPFPLHLEDPDTTNFLNIIIYGDSDAGKTHLLGTALDCDEAYPPLLVDTDGGTITIADWRDREGKPIAIVRPRSWKEMQDLYNWMCHDNTTYRSILIDSLTETQRERSMGEILGEAGEDGYYKNLGQTKVADRQDWLRSGNQMRKFIRAFRNLAYLRNTDRRVHVVMTALERYDEKKRVICPQLPGSLGLECGALVDVLCRLSVHEFTDEDTGEPFSRRHLLAKQYTDADGTRYMAKNRGDRLGRTLWDPTMASIIGAWTTDVIDEV